MFLGCSLLVLSFPFPPLPRPHPTLLLPRLGHSLQTPEDLSRLQHLSCLAAPPFGKVLPAGGSALPSDLNAHQRQRAWQSHDNSAGVFIVMRIGREAPHATVAIGCSRLTARTPPPLTALRSSARVYARASGRRTEERNHGPPPFRRLTEAMVGRL